MVHYFISFIFTVIIMARILMALHPLTQNSAELCCKMNCKPVIIMTIIIISIFSCGTKKKKVYQDKKIVRCRIRGEILKQTKKIIKKKK